MDRVRLYEEFRLIERKENEVNGAWKGVHLLLFFLAFVFGSFCTFCFHMLMYLFDEKCVLFPKLLSLTSSRHNVIYEFIPEEKEGEESPSLPVDFLSTQWVEKSACYLPTFVPLVSGIFGLVWTTLFLMCSTGTRTLTGMQRPWRVLPPVFVFSLAMGILCIYSSSVTHYGLKQLCFKLGEITGASTCSYTVNVATLAYERRIRGVYQATWLTIISAWLHTFCWLLSALVALLRILLAVDFQLVRIGVDLIGDVDKMLENREQQIRTVSPTSGLSRENSVMFDDVITKFHYRSRSAERLESPDMETSTGMDALYYADESQLDQSLISELSLVPDERKKLERHEAFQSLPRNRQFIVKWLYDLLEQNAFDTPNEDLSKSAIHLKVRSMENLLKWSSKMDSSTSTWDTDAETEARRKEFQAVLQKLAQGVVATYQDTAGPSTSRQPQSPLESSSKKVSNQENEEEVIFDKDKALETQGEGRKHSVDKSTLNLTSELKTDLDEYLNEALKDSDTYKKKKSNLKKDQANKSKKHRKVQIALHESPLLTTDSDSEQDTDTTSTETQEKNTQTKEKQD